MRKITALLFAMLFVFASCSEKAAPDVDSTNNATSTTVTEKVTIPTSAEDVAPPIAEPTLYKLSFVAAGDNMIYYGNVRDAARNASGTDEQYDFKPSYTTIKPVIEQYDLAFINQETLMSGGEPSYYPRFNSPQEVGDAVVDSGFDIVGLANNHMLDKGEGGLLATLEYWEKQPVIITGSYRNREEFENIQVFEKNGIDIALLSFTYGTNGLSLPAGSEVFVPYIDNELVAKKVSEAEELADVTIVSIHWGDENTFRVNNQQKEVAKIICENGGDIIIGHHPHIIQSIEWIEVGDNRTICAYSLGNFMSEMAQGYNILGGLFSFDIEKLGENGKAEVKNVLFTPTVFDYNINFYNNHIFFLEDYTDEQARNHGIRYYGNHTTLETLYKYVTDNIDAEFLPEFLKAE